MNNKQKATNWQQVLNFGTIPAETQQHNTAKPPSGFTVLP